MSAVAARRELRDHVGAIEELAAGVGLDYYPVDFEAVPDSLMMEIAVYGLPVRMPHWSFGVRYIYQLVQHRMGHSRLFEVVFPGNPGRAYLAAATGSPRTRWSPRTCSATPTSPRTTSCSAAASSRSATTSSSAPRATRSTSRRRSRSTARSASSACSTPRSRSSRTSTSQRLRAARYPEYAPPTEAPAPTPSASVSGARPRTGRMTPTRAPARAGAAATRTRPALVHRPLRAGARGWERDIFLAVREESFYFYPVFACQIMNEGWASYWHARLLREADFLPQHAYLDAIKCHSDVVRPFAAARTSLAINPYHLGFTLWEHIVEEQGSRRRAHHARGRRLRFVRNQLTRELAENSGCSATRRSANGEVHVPTTTSRRCTRRSSRRSSTSARRASPPRVSRRRRPRARARPRDDGRGLDPGHFDPRARVPAPRLAPAGAGEDRRQPRHGNRARRVRPKPRARSAPSPFAGRSTQDDYPYARHSNPHRRPWPQDRSTMGQSCPAPDGRAEADRHMSACDDGMTPIVLRRRRRRLL